MAAGQSPGRVFYSRSGRVHAKQLNCFETKLVNLKLKTRHKQLLGSIPLDIALSDSKHNALFPPVACTVNVWDFIL
jgi:hypothetical protein